MPKRDVLGDRRREQERVLRRVADHAAQLGERDVRDVVAADADGARRDLLHAQHARRPAWSCPRRSARRSPASRPPAARTRRRPAAAARRRRSQVAHLDRRRFGVTAAAGTRVGGASAIARRRLEQLAHARPAGHAALPDPDDPAEREGRPRQQHQVAVERHQAADASCRPAITSRPPAHSTISVPDAAQHREQRHQRAARPHQRQRALQVLVVDARETPAAAAPPARSA